MSISKNKTLIERYFEEVWNNGELDVLDDIIHQNYINHSPGMPNPEKGPAGLKPIVAAMRVGFPDLNFKIDDLIITDQNIAIRSTMSGTHAGELFGMPATGKKVVVNQFQFEHIQDGKIIEHWRQSDDLGMMKQLGQIV